MAGKLAGSGRTARTFVLAVAPKQFSGRGIECNGIPARPGGRVENSLDHQGRCFQLKLAARAKIIGFETPGHFQFAEVRGVDLIEGRVTRASLIAAVEVPFAVFRAVLGRCGQSRRQYA